MRNVDYSDSVVELTVGSVVDEGTSVVVTGGSVVVVGGSMPPLP